jgi:hypothetical protein
MLVIAYSTSPATAARLVATIITIHARARMCNVLMRCKLPAVRLSINHQSG